MKWEQIEGVVMTSCCYCCLLLAADRTRKQASQSEEVIRMIVGVSRALSKARGCGKRVERV